MKIQAWTDIRPTSICNDQVFMATIKDKIYIKFELNGFGILVAEVNNILPSMLAIDIKKSCVLDSICPCIYNVNGNYNRLLLRLSTKSKYSFLLVSISLIYF